MVFGKTNKDKWTSKQERLEKLKDVWVRVFLFTPKKMTCGRYAWLRFVWKNYRVYSYRGSLECGSFPWYSLDKSI